MQILPPQAALLSSLLIGKSSFAHMTASESGSESGSESESYTAVVCCRSAISMTIIFIFTTTAITAEGCLSPSSFTSCGQIHGHSENINAVR